MIGGGCDSVKSFGCLEFWLCQPTRRWYPEEQLLSRIHPYRKAIILLWPYSSVRLMRPDC